MALILRRRSNGLRPPPGTKTIALIVDDPDALGGTWDHWVLCRLSPSTTSLEERVSANDSGAHQGENDFRLVGHRGPCPPTGHGTHRYFFNIYALDAEPTISRRPERSTLLKAMDGRIVAEGQLVGTYERR